MGIRVAGAQVNLVVGDIQGNEAIVANAIARADKAEADVLLVPELALTGYPPEDLVLQPAFLARARTAVEELARDTADGGPGLIVGAPWLEEGAVDGPLRHHVTNSVFVLDGGNIAGRRDKRDLPNYGVFDEQRIFRAGPLPGPVSFRGLRIGLMICEDMWYPDVAECLEESGAELLVVINGSPFETDKLDERLQLAVARVSETGLPLVYVNQVGGQDELVFDGGSFVLDRDHSVKLQMPSFREALSVTEWRSGPAGWEVAAGERTPPPEGHEAVYRALVLALRDYVDKNRFPGVILGLSGGIDSALSAAVAVDALGPDRVHCVMMPSPYTSEESLEDAAEAAELLGVHLDEVSIEPAMEAFSAMLAPLMNGGEPGVTEENIQSRSRGLTLMALSNKHGKMVLSTGNKSEMSVGYATLYGDMVGGYSVLKDVFKTLIYELARWRNKDGAVIPQNSIDKPPSAELRPDQKDSDSLPDYSILDPILEAFIEEDLSVAQITARGFDRDTVIRTLEMVKRNEYKRRQAPPGVRVSKRAFGRDRRYPITSRYEQD